jgi:transposase InsO family protein
MWRFCSFTRHLGAMTYILLAVLYDAARFLLLCLRPAPVLAAENLFLRKQLAQYRDRDTIFSKTIDQNVSHMGLRVIKTPARTPVANSICERVLGTLRRECLDFVIALNDKHLYSILKEWVGHYNQGRPHMSLGPGVPEPIQTLPVRRQLNRHRLPAGQRLMARPILGGLHHDDQMEQAA